MELRFCEHCGKQIEPDDRFCHACGGPVTSDKGEQVVVSDQAPPASPEAPTPPAPSVPVSSAPAPVPQPGAVTQVTVGPPPSGPPSYSLQAPGQQAPVSSSPPQTPPLRAPGQSFDPAVPGQSYGQATPGQSYNPNAPGRPYAPPAFNQPYPRPQTPAQAPYPQSGYPQPVYPAAMGQPQPGPYGPYAMGPGMVAPVRRKSKAVWVVVAVVVLVVLGFGAFVLHQALNPLTPPTERPPSESTQTSSGPDADPPAGLSVADVAGDYLVTPLGYSEQYTFIIVDNGDSIVLHIPDNDPIVCTYDPVTAIGNGYVDYGNGSTAVIVFALTMEGGAMKLTLDVSVNDPSGFSDTYTYEGYRV